MLEFDLLWLWFGAMKGKFVELIKSKLICIRMLDIYVTKLFVKKCNNSFYKKSLYDMIWKVFHSLLWWTIDIQNETNSVTMNFIC